ncbi:MAG TPA: hypothetical protein V6D03_06240 [Candidatus Caenarcaniphilales bacterium]
MLDRFSWILPQHLAVGPFPKTSVAIAFLRRMGVTAVLCLTEENERSISSELFHNFVWERVPIPDGFTGGIPTEEQFALALQILHRWHQKAIAFMYIVWLVWDVHLQCVWLIWFRARGLALRRR